MHAIRIQHLRARYHLPPSAGGQRRRLDGLLAAALVEGLEPALDRAGMGPDEHLCIRHLAVVVRLRLSAPDPSLIATWSDALGSALSRAADQGLRGRGTGLVPEVVWFASTAHALFDLGWRVAGHDLRHAWAWRQLDLWRAEDAVSAPAALRELLRALLRNPDRIVSTVGALAETSALGVLASRLESEHWIALAAAALGSALVDVHAADLSPRPRSRIDDEGGGVAGEDSPTTSTPPAFASGPGEGRPWIHRLAARSRIGRVLPLASVSVAARRALGSLILLDAEPGWALRPRNQWLTALRELVQPRQADPIRDDGEPAGRRAADPTTAHEDVTSPSGESGERGGESGESTRRVGTGETEGGVEGEGRGGDGDDAHDDPGLDLRRRGRTRQGGLLFVLNLLNTPAWLDRLTSGFPGRGLRWGLIQLATALVPVASGDPAALAFAGLAPGSEPFSADEPPPEPEELEGVARLARRIRGELADGLTRLELTPDAAVEFVCARPAEIVADPGWIEARFALSDVSTDLRRAGLDQDPGYVRWLGCVVRFAYE